MKALLADITLAPWCGAEPTTLVDEHHLGAGRQVGRTLVQIVHHRERWTAILVWGPAAMKFIDRDEWIGWTSRQRAERLGLIVQNRRFLLLTLALSMHESGTPVAITSPPKIAATVG